MRGAEVLVVPTGTANTASVLAGLERIGARPRIAAHAAEAAAATPVVLPGVGAFGAAVERLAAAGFRDVLRARLRAGRPTLAVCLGLQLLCRDSEETPGAVGLGVVAATVRRFRDAPRVPHIGWNRIEPTAGARLLRPGYAYFANSYRLDGLPSGWEGAHATYGERFVAALERGAVLACQFHPELSGAWGRELLARWLAAATGAGAERAGGPPPAEEVPSC